MNTTFDARSFVKDLVNALNKKDPESILRHYADDCELTDPTTQQPLRGKEGVRKNVTQWANAMSELEIDVKESVTAGNKAVLLFEGRGRHTGELEMGPGEKIPATNKPLRLEVANFLTLDSSGKITKDHSIFDVASMMMQLGLLPDTQRASSASQRGAALPASAR